LLRDERPLQAVQVQGAEDALGEEPFGEVEEVVLAEIDSLGAAVDLDSGGVAVVGSRFSICHRRLSALCEG
jgi:hypothetical protein